MGFRFRFEALLKIRSRRLELAESELGRILRELYMVKEEYRGVQNRIKKATEALDKSLAEGLSARDLQNSTGFVKRLRAERDRLIMEQAALEKKAHEAREKVRYCLMEKKIAERLKEKDFKRYIEKQKRIEQMEADETASQRHGRGIYGQVQGV